MKKQARTPVKNPDIFFRYPELQDLQNRLSYILHTRNKQIIVLYGSKGCGKSYFLKKLKETLPQEEILSFDNAATFLNPNGDPNINCKKHLDDFAGILKSPENIAATHKYAIVDDYDKACYNFDPNAKNIRYGSPVLDLMLLNGHKEIPSEENPYPYLIPILVIDTDSLSKLRNHSMYEYFSFFKIRSYNLDEIKEIILNQFSQDENIDFKDKFTSIILDNSSIIKDFSFKKSLEIIKSRNTQFKNIEESGSHNILQIAEEVLLINSSHSRSEIKNILEMKFSKEELIKKIDEHIVLKTQNKTQISNLITIKHLGLSNPKKPVAVVFETGQTGSGKTFCAQMIAKLAYGSEDRIVKINMNDYNSSHHINKLTGSAPGYVGYGNDTFLTRELSKIGSGVILFDEIEKAHSEVQLALLNILDEGFFTDGSGKEVDLRSCIIVLTSNIGSSLFSKNNLGKVGFQDESDNTENILITQREIFKDEMLKAGMAAEFINRIDYLLVFPNLSKEELKKVANINLQKMLQTEFKKWNISLEDKDEIENYIVSKTNLSEGGRSVLRVLTRIKSSIIDKLGSSINKETISFSKSDINEEYII